jgi:hypothetical protein
MSDDDKKAFAEWALVELMGRQRIFGYVTEVVIFGAPMMRVDVPDAAGETVLTRFYGNSAIYAVSPITKAACLAMVGSQDAAPIKTWELPAPALEPPDAPPPPSFDDIGF